MARLGPRAFPVLLLLQWERSDASEPDSAQDYPLDNGPAVNHATIHINVDRWGLRTGFAGVVEQGLERGTGGWVDRFPRCARLPPQSNASAAASALPHVYASPEDC